VRSLVLEFQAELPGFGGMMSERGIRLAHTTILRWVQHYTLEFREARLARGNSPSGGRLLAVWMRRCGPQKFRPSPARRLGGLFDQAILVM
jgi:hypothetical protein